MRAAGIYLVQADISSARISSVPEGDILLTLRIGRNYATAVHHPSTSSAPLQFNSTLQVNVDSSALDSQRCSLTLALNGGDKRVIGIALISLPKDKNQISSSYRLTQNEDKKAQVDVKIRIAPFDGSSLKGGNTNTLAVNSEATGRFEEVREGDAVREGASNSLSNIKVKSRTSDQQGEGSEVKRMPKSFKVQEKQRRVQVAESELKRYKQEKQAYYQMYQIEKSKNEVAAKFISGVIKKLTEKYPDLMPLPAEMPELAMGKKASELPKAKHAEKQNDGAAMAQIEQANRSLHRQIDEYKKVVEQLKQQLASFTRSPEEALPTRKNQLLPPSVLDIVPKQSSKQKYSNIIPSSLKETAPQKEPTNADIQREVKQAFVGVDLKKWLGESIGQRKQLQAKLAVGEGVGAPERSDSKAAFMKKLRSGIDKSFSQLMVSKELNRNLLLSHKQEINRVLDEYAF